MGKNVIVFNRFCNEKAVKMPIMMNFQSFIDKFTLSFNGFNIYFAIQKYLYIKIKVMYDVVAVVHLKWTIIDHINWSL